MLKEDEKSTSTLKPINTNNNDTNKIQVVIASSISGVTQLVSLQLFSRIITFILNQVIVRRVGSKTYGAATIDFELLSSTILFLSREGFRCALLRSDGGLEPNRAELVTNKKQLQINLTYLPIPMGFIIAGMFIVLRLTSSDFKVDSSYYYPSALLYIIAAILELFSEPFYIMALSELNYRLRVQVEGLGVLVRCFATYIISYLVFQYFSDEADNYALLAFGLAQLLYSLVLLVGYFGHFYFQTDTKILFPKPVAVIPNSPSLSNYFDMELFKLSVTLSIQSFVKHLLTEGDKLLLAYLDQDGEGKGRYSLAAHYGSLVARILFQPLEEASRGLFSKLLKDAPKANDNYRQSNSAMSSAANIINTMLKFHLLFGMIFIFFVPHYTSTLFDLILGPSWSQTNAPTILSVYCIYIPIMGINGITEAFVQAVAQPGELQSLSYAMFFFTILFLLFGYYLLSILPTIAYAVILANCFNLSLRIAWSLNFIINYFSQNNQNNNSIKFSISKSLPSMYVILAFSLSSGMCYYSKIKIGTDTLIRKLLHILVGGGCFLITSGIIWVSEQEFRTQLKTLLTNRKLADKED